MARLAVADRWILQLYTAEIINRVAKADHLEWSVPAASAVDGMHQIFEIDRHLGSVTILAVGNVGGVRVMAKHAAVQLVRSLVAVDREHGVTGVAAVAVDNLPALADQLATDRAGRRTDSR